MMEAVPVDRSWTLEDYATISHLVQSVRNLRTEAAMTVPPLKNRTVWMVNSTARGGGVAEMLPRMVTLLEDLGVPCRWLVMGSDQPEFFALTKRLHNLVHGDGDPRLGPADRALYEAVNRKNADELKKIVSPDDILVIHDPQPLPMGAMLKREIGIRTIWRCHIGHDAHLPATRAAWAFMQPYAEEYDHTVFSSPDYIPDYLSGRAMIIHPALDPFSHKNRELSTHKLVGVLCNSGLLSHSQPVVTPPFDHMTQRLRPDGTFGPPSQQDEIGLLFRPIVTQVSRWDRLKGWSPLLDAFVQLKNKWKDADGDVDARTKRRMEIVRLVLAGPDPASIQDDPEGTEVLQELVDRYKALPADVQKDVVVLSLPMHSRKENALVVNALQRCSSAIVQNSIREGFGLTATEAMWKRVGILGTRACGLRTQIRSGIDGVLTQDPQDIQEVSARLDDMINNVPKRDLLARSAQRRVHDKYLIFTQLKHWLDAFNTCLSAPRKRTESQEG